MLASVQLRGTVGVRGHSAVNAGKEILIFGGESRSNSGSLELSNTLLLLSTGTPLLNAVP
jgi:hypothetical protein